MRRKRKLTLTKKREIYGLFHDYYFKGKMKLKWVSKVATFEGTKLPNKQ